VPEDEDTRSGLSFYIGKALREYVGDVDTFAPVRDPWWLRRMLRFIAGATAVFSSSEYAPRYSLLRNRYAGRALSRQIQGRAYDFILATDSWSGAGYMKTSLPVICMSISTFRQFTEELGGFKKKLSRFSGWEGNHLQGRVLRGSLAAIFASQWAARSGLADYKVPRERIFVLPPGGRLNEAPGPAAGENKLDNPRLTLLFYGSDWESKGGPIALDTLINLQDVYRMDARLIVCGCIPPPSCKHPAMEVLPILDKNDPGDLARFGEYLSAAHFLIQPSRSDAILPVACEGNAYGVPVITSETGGIPDVIQDGVNGYCLPYHSDSRMYALLISELFQDTERYRQLAASSRTWYEERLSWEHWGERFNDIYARAISGHQT
jgi:glycosyltransferase involved in cell wall biosynthesis